jgi:hypothetical protein
MDTELDGATGEKPKFSVQLAVRMVLGVPAAPPSVGRTHLVTAIS